MERFSIEVCNEQGQICKIYPHHGQNFVCGEKGKAYDLIIRNNTPGKVLAVATVDGLSIMDGKVGSTRSEHGYVLDMYQTVTIPGWRLDNENVARFRFGGPEAGYAAQMGADLANVGVIGCAFYESKVQTPNVQQHRVDQLHSRGGTYKGASGPSGQSLGFSGDNIRSIECSVHNKGEQALGTQFGEKAQHRVNTVDFQRRDTPAEVLTLRYNDLENLIKMGVVTDYVPPGSPNPFPADPVGAGCPTPPNWKG